MPSILIVDDEMEDREFLRTVLAHAGHEVVTARHVDQGLEALAKRPFDLIILDAHIRGESCPELIRKVRQAKNRIPIVVYTTRVTQAEEDEFRQAGAADIVIKGAGVSSLLESLSKWAPGRGKPAASRPSARTALVVDDDASVRAVLKRFLVSRHFMVQEADSGRAAVECVRSSGPLAVVFLDVNMPGELDGIAALQEIRLLRPELGVIMVTGEQDDRTIGRAVELGAAGYVVKPFDFLYLEMMLVSKLDAARGGT